MICLKTATLEEHAAARAAQLRELPECVEAVRKGVLSEDARARVTIGEEHVERLTADILAHTERCLAPGNLQVFLKPGEEMPEGIGYR